jgi:hypothetical protein
MAALSCLLGRSDGRRYEECEETGRAYWDYGPGVRGLLVTFTLLYFGLAYLWNHGV